jgi:hypothetical protein
MKLQITCVLFCVLFHIQTAGAQFHCPHESGKSWVVEKLPKIGCSDMIHGGELLTEADVKSALKRHLDAWEAQQKEIARETMQIELLLLKKRAGHNFLAKRFPKACEKIDGQWVCSPVPGMPILPLTHALELEIEGFTHTASGRVDRYSFNDCRIYARKGVVTLVSC